ncbi:MULTISPECIES: hypothetical protein [unclassified Treponema]|uniref:hypothetical protein n=1 Tax=unclassified Treponema TaxID=2638727 RepID=UPI0020A4E012|nr:MULTISPECIES: hypothetical protein [unclassified Treponema]UTC67415.1 hypothetical protein E4O06_01730 [Treponema sp. OMZ 789]UTC70143.1 hypothetical protein E4O01_01725 [Treponema sp. OMZ 790]UTC72858.1 hypothetical protein E4O02_01725 [Treponema sp. OMZ 791]
MPDKISHILISKIYLEKTNDIEEKDYFYYGAIYPDLYDLSKKEEYYKSHFIQKGAGYSSKLFENFIKKHSYAPPSFLKGVDFHIFTDHFVSKNLNRYYSFYTDIKNKTDEDLSKILSDYALHHCRNEKIIPVALKEENNDKILHSFYEFEKYRKMDIGDISSVNKTYPEFIDEIIAQYLNTKF